MNLRSIRSAALAAAALFAALAVPQAVSAQALTDAQKGEIGAIVRDYLMKNPEVIEEAMQALEKKRAQEADEARSRMMTEKSGILFNSARQAVHGNPNGDVTIVEFFDYNCGFCKRGLQDVQTLLKNDPKVRYVLKEFPVLGPGSVEAARVSIALNRIAPEKHMDFHVRLLGGRGQADKARALAVAAEVGVDTAKLEKELTNPEVAATIEEVYALATGLGLNGTPTYVVGQEVIPGAVGLDKLTEQVKRVRSCGVDATKC